MNSILLNVFTGAIARRSDLPVTGPMPGVRPQHEMSESHGIQAEELHPAACIALNDVQWRSSSSSPDSPDDQFLDSMSRQNTPPTRSEESNTPSYLLFGTGTSTISELGESDWRYYDPPRELTELQAESSREIKDILKSSIESIKARHNEEAETLLREMAREEMSQLTTSERSEPEVIICNAISMLKLTHRRLPHLAN